MPVLGVKEGNDQQQNTEDYENNRFSYGAE